MALKFPRFKTFAECRVGGGGSGWVGSGGVGEEGCVSGGWYSDGGWWVVAAVVNCICGECGRWQIWWLWAVADVMLGISVKLGRISSSSSSSEGNASSNGGSVNDNT